jgi:hypothetical protein
MAQGPDSGPVALRLAETVCFTLSIRGSYAESRWAASLAALGVPPAGVHRNIVAATQAFGSPMAVTGIDQPKQFCQLKFKSAKKNKQFSMAIASTSFRNDDIFFPEGG